MNYEQEEKFRELKAIISSYSKHNNTYDNDLKAKEADLTWEASRFFAKAIHLAQPLRYEISLKDFDNFKTSYEIKNGNTIDSDALFNKFWLRTILGYVEIAGNVSSACFTFNRIIDFKEELKFLYKFSEKQTVGHKKIEKNKLEDAIKEYEVQNDVKLKSEGVYFNNWLSEKDGKIELSDINHYFKPYLDYWDDFKFVSALKEFKNNSEEKGLQIGKVELEGLHQAFFSFYPKMPPIQQLLAEKALRSLDNYYYLNFYNTEIRYWSELSDKISGYYWEILVDDVAFESDKDRVKRFLGQTSYWNDSHDPLRYSSESAKEKFLNAALELTLAQEDIEGIETEFQKVSIDRSLSSGETYYLFYKPEKFFNFSLNNIDYFELLESLDNWETKAQTTFLYDQSSRKKLSYLIKIVVKHDYEAEGIRRIFQLLKASLTKPILIWDTTRYLIMYREEVVPYLLKNKEFISVAFQIIPEFKFAEAHKEVYFKDLWVKCIDLALFTIRSIISDEKDLASKSVFQIYRQLNSHKYDTTYYRHTKKLGIQIHKQTKEKEEAVLIAIENSPLYNHSIRGANQEYLLPILFNNLFVLFNNFENTYIYNNGSIAFPMLKWDALSWLLKCSTYWKYKQQLSIIKPNTQSITNSFLKSYTDIIEVTQTSKYNHFAKKMETGLPSWSEKIERLESIEWVYPLYFISKQGSLSSFLSPRFYFETSENEHCEQNDFTRDKLRTHLGVLIQVLKKLILPAIPYGFERSVLLDIKQKIEQQIIDYLKLHIADVPKEGKIDLFHPFKESPFNASDKEALFPQVARVINWFDRKEDVIEAIVNTQDIAKILTLSEWLTSEGIKMKVIDKIKQVNIRTFLEKSHRIPEVQQTLFKIRQYPELVNEIKKVAEYWQEKIADKKWEYEAELFKTKLLIAYFEKDEKALNTIQLPQKDKMSVIGELSYYHLREFYKALLKIDNEPSSAHRVFNDLLIAYPKYPVFAANRFAAKINWAEKGNDLALYREAIEEWYDYENKQEESDVEAIGSSLLINKLTVFLHLEEHGEIDSLFSKVELPYQMLPSILEVKIKSLIKRNRRDEAFELLENAENYHKFSGFKEIEFIKDLKDEINGIDNIDELRVHYGRIFNSEPTKLIKIFPDHLNGKNEITEFITKEVAIAASRMLDKIHSLPDIMTLKNTSKENRYNDLIQLTLESRISLWGWTVKDQTRKSSSPSHADLGEIDLDIQDYNKQSFMTCVAFILREPSKVASHLEKLISHYTHNRKSFLALVYYIGSHADFEKDWKHYFKTTLSSIKYPTGYELDSNEVQDVTKEFGYDFTGIRIGRATLISGSVLYHIFVNIYYNA